MYLLDHVVHFVDKPEKMIEETKKIGLHTVQGGKHEVWGTYNSLCYIGGLSYIEFIGVFDQALLEKSASIPYTLHSSYQKRNFQNGLTRFALRTISIDEDAEKFRAAGLDVRGPETFSRIRPDGSKLSWKLLHFGKDDVNLDYPFLIQWDEMDEDRSKQLAENGTIGMHALGDLQFEEICLEVEQVKTGKDWALLFNFEIIDETSQFIKLKAPNCVVGFYKGLNNQIAKIRISGSHEYFEAEIEGGQYQFNRYDLMK